MAAPSAEQPAPAPPAGTASAETAAVDATPLYHGTDPLVHSACLAAAVLGPVGLLLPPRRMGLRALLLAGGTAIGTNQLVYDFSGQTVAARLQARLAQLGPELPEPARQRQAAMRAERERRAAAQAAAQGQAPAVAPTEKPQDWVAERQRKEREVLEAGGGYWDLIVGQINEVWTDLRGKGK